MTARPDQGDQLELPFLTPDRAAAVHAAAVAIGRSVSAAIARRAPVEADELERVGDQLMRMLDDNAAAVRRQNAHRPGIAPPGGAVSDQRTPVNVAERTQ